MKSAKIITLTTDFGLRDPYVAEMKAVILSLCPEAVIVDVTHQVPKFDIRMGAYLLASAAPYFPKGAIHVAVIDPGVGTTRRNLIIRTKHNLLVGPDNGVLALAAKREQVSSVHEITSPESRMPKVSSTFHGRDILAPTAAQLANGVQPSSFGSAVRDIAEPKFTKVVLDDEKKIGEVLYVDGFGNIVTNLPEEALKGFRTGESIIVSIKNRPTEMKVGKTYGEAQHGEYLVLMGSQGYVEIAKNQGNAHDELMTKPGDRITILAPKPGLSSP